MDQKYNLSNLAQYRVNVGDQPVVQRQTLYDFQLYPTAGQTRLQFFQQQIGQGLSSSPGAAAMAKSLADTNMTLSGQLAAPLAFLVESIEVHFLAGSVNTANTYTPQTPKVFAAVDAVGVNSGVNDTFAVLGSGALRFQIGSIDWLQEAELYRFPPKAYRGLDGFGYSDNQAAASASNVAAAQGEGRPYYMDPELVLATSQNFAVTLEWPAAVATPSGFNGRIGVVLDGVLFRLAQ